MSSSSSFSSPVRICVLGAGAVGLSTAVQIQEYFEKHNNNKKNKKIDFEITLIAEKFNRETTSDGAAGIFQSNIKHIKGIDRAISRRWFRDSFDFYKKLVASSEGPEAGLLYMTGYEFYIEDEFDDDPLHNELYFQRRPCNEKEYQLFGLNNKAYHGDFYTTLMVEGRWFLPWLIKKFEKKGGKVVQKKVLSFEELSCDFEVIMNCTGLGSNQLCGNQEVVPIRGQVLRVEAPWIKHFLVVDGYQFYAFPCKENVILGGTRQYGDSELGVRKEDRERFWNLACQYIPSLKKAKWCWEWVGLRPLREPPRVEREKKKLNGKDVEIIHNFGHGGNGMALCWGTGCHATRLFDEFIQEKYLSHNKNIEGFQCKL